MTLDLPVRRSGPSVRDSDRGSTGDDRPDRTVCVVAARLPIAYDRIHGWRRSPGGLVSALEPTLRSRRATWFGHLDEGDPDPPGRSATLEIEPIRISGRDRALAHDGFCNRTLWPALHGLATHVEQRDEWWLAYLRRNEATARIVADRAGPGALVWVHDYHYFAMAAPLRAARPDLRIGLFCHTPIDDRVLGRIARSRALAAAMRHFSMIAVQTDADADALRAFLACAGGASTPGPPVVTEPVGIDVAAWTARRTDDVVGALAERHRRAGGTLAVGVDRVDYTKGLLHKLHAIEIALGDGGLTADGFRLVQIAVPSRTSIPVYAYLDDQVRETVARLNRRHPRRDGLPVVELVGDQIPPREVAAFMRAADLAVITPARDGMNLVALEYSTLNGDRPCDVVLSEGAGAARHIGDWCDLVDGTDVMSIASAIQRCVRRPRSSATLDRSHRRAAAARALTADRWAERFLAHLSARAAGVPRFGRIGEGYRDQR